ncbi:MAG: DinB family protein [Chloroflexi bacterium]|nr:DinB family protein [Chloroflexota bacterium]
MFTPQDRRDLVAKLESHRDALFRQAESLPVERLTSAWKEGDRTPMGMLLHVISAERRYRDDWARRARDEDAPDLRQGGEAQGGAPLFEEANQMSREELVQRLKQERLLTLRFIAETGDTEFDRKGRNTPFGDLTIHQLLKSLYRHDQMHIDEMAGQPSRYVVTTQDGRRL